MSVLDPSEQNFVFAHMHSEIIWVGLSGVKVKKCYSYCFVLIYLIVSLHTIEIFFEIIYV